MTTPPNGSADHTSTLSADSPPTGPLHLEELLQKIPQAEQELARLVEANRSGSDVISAGILAEIQSLSSTDRAALILLLAESGGLFQDSPLEDSGLGLLAWVRHFDPQLSFLAEVIEQESLIRPRLAEILCFIDHTVDDPALRSDLMEVILELHGSVLSDNPSAAAAFHDRLRHRPEEFSPLSTEIIKAVPAPQISYQLPVSTTPAPSNMEIHETGEERISLSFNAGSRQQAAEWLRNELARRLQTRKQAVILATVLHLIWMIALVARVPGAHLPDLLLALGSVGLLSAGLLALHFLNMHNSLCLAEGATTLMLLFLGVPGWPWPLIFPILAWKISRQFNIHERRKLERIQFAAALLNSITDQSGQALWNLDLNHQAENVWLGLESDSARLSLEDRDDPGFPGEFARMTVLARGSVSGNSGERNRYFKAGVDPQAGLFASGDAIYGDTSEEAARELARLFIL